MIDYRRTDVRRPPARLAFVESNQARAGPVFSRRVIEWARHAKKAR